MSRSILLVLVAVLSMIPRSATALLETRVGISGCPSISLCFTDVSASYSAGLADGDGMGGPLSITDTRIGNGGTSTGTATAEFGQLGVFAFVSRPDDPNPRDYSTAFAQALFNDEIEVEGPPGQVAVVIFTSTLTGLITPSRAHPSYPNGIPVDSSTSGYLRVILRTIGPQQIYDTYWSNQTNVAGIAVQSGGSIEVYMSLVAETRVYASDNLNPTRTVNLLNTGRLYAQSESPAFTLSARSGHDYSPPSVPEPALALLVAVGIGVFAPRILVFTE